MANTSYSGVFKHINADGTMIDLYPDTQTDKTLSQSGKAADAAAVGEALASGVDIDYSELEFDTEEILVEGAGGVSGPDTTIITGSADDIEYDNTSSGMTATNVQEAIDELKANSGSGSADGISYDNSVSGIAATNIQEAIDAVFRSASDGKQAIIDAIAGSNGQEFTLENSFEEIAAYIANNCIVLIGNIVLYPDSEICGWNGDKYVGYTDYFDVSKFSSIVVSATAYAPNGYTNNSNRFWSYSGRAVITVEYADGTTDSGTVTFDRGTSSASGGTSTDTFTFDTSGKTGNCKISVQSYYKNNAKWEDGSSGPWTAGTGNGYGYITSAIGYA